MTDWRLGNRLNQKQFVGQIIIERKIKMKVKGYCGHITYSGSELSSGNSDNEEKE